ncbi:MAG: hypothetical protein H6736_10345 [Alphaproteobacteria bacterium]|nr:hypothetical protein [Alphaproteobacteria bacterium]
MSRARAALAVLVAGPWVLWLLSWHIWLGAVWWTATAVTFARRERRDWLLPLGVLLVPWCVWRYTARVTVLTEAVRHGGAAALSVVDLFAVWGLNLVMAAAGFVLGFPEVAVETALLTVPRGDELSFTSTRFPLCEPKVAATVRAQVARGGGGPERLAWRYGEPGSSWRAALALNPVEVSTHRGPKGFVMEARVPVDYRGFYPLVLGELGPLRVVVEEGLFHAAQERGWLSPYTLTWRAEVPEDYPPPCEAWSARLVQSLL